MKNFSLVLFLLLGAVSANTSSSQESFTLSGIVYEEDSNETLIGVNIVFPDLRIGTTTNAYGYYSITLPKGHYNLTVSYLGYSTINKTITIQGNSKKTFRLNKTTESLGEVVIGQSNIKSPQMSVSKLLGTTIKETPVVLGEPDLIKAITLLPGVTNAGESSSGFNVRGGAVDQNLILLDEATIFNTSHLFGLFSIFNTDAIKYLKLYKGGIPARYGGRVSSVLDIYQKEGNSKTFHASGGVGVVSSKLIAQGPIKKNKASFLFGGRSSYAHLFLPFFDIQNKAYFYDVNMKLSHKPNFNNNFYISAYYGRDLFKVDDTFENLYGNTILNFRWNHLFSDKLFSNLSLIYSDYVYGLNLEFIEFDWKSGIESFNLKYDFKHHTNDHLKLRFGINSFYYKFNPGDITPNTETSGINAFKLTDKYALENAAYLDIEHKLSDKLTLSYGLRVSNFLRLGQDELNIYENDQPVIFNDDFKIYERAEPIRTDTFERKDIIADFTNLEPRASLALQLSPTSSLKLGYNRMSQYLHLLSNTNAPTPLDIWTPSGKYVKPQLLDQVAMGYFKDFEKSGLSVELETFYKTVKNRIDYVDGADLVANNTIERVILNGRARAYGLEFLLHKDQGRFRWWLAYTLSKSEQQTRGRTATETGINNGNWYNTPYDKTHDVSFTGGYQISKKLKVNTNFLFQTGQPQTFPNGQYQFNNIIVPNYNGRNSDRLPAYHRVDISLNYTPKPEKIKGWRSHWVFSIYNAYNRRNANSIDFVRNRRTGENEAVRLAIFGIVPSLSYNFSF